VREGKPEKRVGVAGIENTKEKERETEQESGNKNEYKMARTEPERKAARCLRVQQ